MLAPFIILAVLLLSACSFTEEVSESLNYVTEAQNYLQSLEDFIEKAPKLIQDSAIKQEAKDELTYEVKELTTSINEFNQLDAPIIIEEVHQEIVKKNKQLLEEINSGMQNGEIVLEKMEEIKFIETINDITSLLDTIKKFEL